MRPGRCSVAHCSDTFGPYSKTTWANSVNPVLDVGTRDATIY